MRTLLLSCLLALSFTASAQTYYYVNSIGVAPSAPTTADPVTITLYGDLSASNSFIINTSFNVVGGQVQITVNAGTQGIGLPALVPHNESFSLGTLAAGTYTITISGSGTGDFAPAPEHQFTVVAAALDACDSLLINSIAWAPFSDTAIMISTSNYSATLFDYPGFILFNDQGDTLAKENVNYFGIGQGPQVHTLIVQPGATIPAGPFNAMWELWTLFYQSLGCTFSGAVDLCPPAPCAALQVGISNVGGAMVNSTFDYAVTDFFGSTVGSGTLTLDALDQTTTADLCLPPGPYTLTMVQPNAVGGQLVYGVGTELIGGPQQPFIQGGASNTIPFQFYPACYNGPNSISENGTTPAMRCTLTNGLLTIRGDDGRALGPITVFDAQGRVVTAASGPSHLLTLDVSTVPEGLLLVQRTGANGARSVERVMNVR